ncbi:MAG: hypothetical protein ACJ790_11470 [Myxococcaceae bacterium]
MAWYWKINEALKVLRSVDSQLDSIVQIQKRTLEVQQELLNAAHSQSNRQNASGM